MDLKSREKVSKIKIIRHDLDGRDCSSDSKTENMHTSQKIDFSDKSISLNDFLPIKQNKPLGRGAYGEVELVQNIASKNLYAFKIIKKKNLNRSGTLKMIHREISVQKKLIHPNIIRLYGHIEDSESLYLILEYAEKGNLFHYIRKKKRLYEEEAFYYFTQVCFAINYLHEHDIIHRDVKPENILITSKNIVKICDFGWCAEGIEERTTYCGTLDYMAPEIVLRNRYTNKVDIWALGVLLYEMTHGYPPFNAKNDLEKSILIKQSIINFSDKVSTQCKDLLTLILQENPKNRPSIITILKHPWFSKFKSIVYKDKVDFGYYAPGSQVTVENFGEGIVVSSQGLICEVSFESETRSFIIPEIYKQHDGGSSRSLTSMRFTKDKSVNDFCENKDIESKLQRNYPPSYKQSGGKPPRTPIISSDRGAKIKRRLRSEISFYADSPILKHSSRCETSNYMISQQLSLDDSIRTFRFSNSSEDSDVVSNIIEGEAFENKLRQLQSLQEILESPHLPQELNEKPIQKPSLLSRIIGIFTIGCADR
ncbi:hypothetical protein SteCoe_34485 [Stentor coeruleus]|uniref:Aurora kinase n=1 Tax=Stentor coeruleus TaxID=5963 RepID=A0A1R2AUG9_9CILI|nr:hypothetical protein SteCoe_34485 [Stentor coeruleus]